MIGGIRTCLGFSDDPVFLWISLNFCPWNLLAEITIVKRLVQGRNSVTRVRVEPRSFDKGVVKTTPLPIRSVVKKWLFLKDVFLPCFFVCFFVVFFVFFLFFLYVIVVFR